MKSIMFVGLLCVLVQPEPSIAAEPQRPAAVTDVPEKIDLSYALPDAWHALPPPISSDQKPPSPPPRVPDDVGLTLSSARVAAL